MATNKFEIVDTEYGSVKGVQKTTALGRNFYSFRSVPYMKAPTGKLRFRDAQQPEKWSEPLDATGQRSSYFSLNPITFQVEGQEDAGIVSIATPYMDRKLPVVVYIHGGGFQFAYGQLDMYGSDYLLQKDVVYVTINYRVGPIGFLSLNDPSLDIPGNAGLKDQVFALQWVQRNIAKFGGDPENVTLCGTSAGAASIHLMMMTDKAKGLFHRAIPMSGNSFVKGWLYAPRKDFPERLATLLGWDGTGGEKNILEVLENATAKDIVLAESKLLTKKEIIVEHILFPFTAVIEPYVNEKTFLSKDPVLLGRDAWSKDIDCMLGGTSLEGGTMGAFGENFHEFVQSYEALAPSRELRLDLLNDVDKRKASAYDEKLKRLYFGDKLPSPETRHEYMQYFSDLHNWHGIYRAVLSRVNSSGNGKTFFYRFDVQTSLNFGKSIYKLTYDGTAHGDDLSYLFKPEMNFVAAPAVDSIEFKKIIQMVSFVTSFIINGNPNSFDDDTTWEPVSLSTPVNCLNIANESTEMIPLPELERMKVWDEILSDENIPLY